MIRWINEKLGTAAATDSSIARDASVLDVRDLVDKSGNAPAATLEKVEQGLALLHDGKRVVVCCDHGISRSNAIAAGILSRWNAIPLDQAIQEVMHATGEQEIKLEPLRAVRSALLGSGAAAVEARPRVLLTGAAGFIGPALLRELSRHYHVLAPSREAADLAGGALALDLLVKRHRINCIVHLANPRVYTANRAVGEMLAALCNVLDVCRENGMHLIFPSSLDVYAGYRGAILADASQPRFPKGAYGQAKLLCELTIEQHAKLYGLKCAILRSAPMYGGNGRRPKFLYTFIEKATRNAPIQTHVYLNGEPALDLLHVNDFSCAVRAALDAGLSGVLNIGSGRAVGTRQLAEWIVSEINSRSPIISRQIEDYTANITVDIGPAQERLSWQPAVTWESGLGRLIGQAPADQAWPC